MPAARITRSTRRSAPAPSTSKSAPSADLEPSNNLDPSASRRLVLQPSYNSENSLSNLMNSTSDLTRLQNTSAVTMTMTIGGYETSKIINNNQNNNMHQPSQSLPAKRSLSDRVDGDESCHTTGTSNAPSSPSSRLKGRATRGNSQSNSVPPSPSRNTRAARASARANAKERSASESPAADDGSPNSTNSTNSNGGRSSKRAKLDHPPAPPSDGNGSTNATTSESDIVIDAEAEAVVPAQDGGAVVSPNTSSNGGNDQTTGEDESRSATPTHKNTNGGGGSSSSMAEVPPPAAPQAPAPSAAARDDSASTTTNGDDNSATTTSASASASASARPQSPPPPLKSLTMHHLRKKYLQELEYMSVEFRKLEKQLLGARGGGGDANPAATAPSTESAASRERREKLHSFIVHLEDTIQQIKDGCQAEADGGASAVDTTPTVANTAATTDASTDKIMTAVDEDHPATTDNDDNDNKAKRDFANSAALTKLTREKEQEETVQKLEEHILANLLPVKVRLTKQLAAQQGAARNPAGMPTSARGPRPSAAAMSGGKGTFAAAAEERRKREEAARLAASQQSSSSPGAGAGGGGTTSEESAPPPLQPPPAPSILGKPLKGGGSSLTARLHGATLGSKARTSGHGVGQAQPAVQSPRAKEPGIAKVASTTTEDSFDSTSGESGQPKRKILFAGMTPGSEQVSSSVSAAQGAHKMVVTDPTLRAAHRAGLAAEAIEEGAGALASLSSSKVPPPPPAPRGTKAKAGVVRLAHPGAPKPALVVTSGSDSSNDAVVRGSSTRSSTVASRSTAVPAGPASAAVAKVQAQQVATAAQLAARAKARAAAGLPPIDTPVTSSAAAELRRTGKKSTANRGTKRRLSEKNLTDEEKERLIRRRDRRQRRRKKAKRLERERIRHAAFAAQARQAQAQQSAAAVAAAAAAVAEQNKADSSKQGGGAAKAGSSKSSSSSSSADKKAGPRTVEYICGLCNEVYVSTCEANPWWCLRQQDCPKCGKRQVPRIDISAPANSIQYHPALLAHAEDSSSGGSGGGASVALRAKGPAPSAYIASAHLAPPPKFPDLSELYESESEASDDDEAVSLEGDSSDESDDDDGLKTYNGNLSPSERAEAEDFGTDYAGPKLKDNEASRLLVLMGHAQCCPGRHKVGKMREVCQNTKFMMMHVRDCPGTTSTFDVCPFPWCRKVKHLLYHLVSCEKPEECSICTPTDIPPTLKALRGLNAHRHKKHREKLRAAAAAAASARATATKARAPAPAPYANVKKGAPSVSKVTVSKHPITSKHASSAAKSGIARHPGAPVPNPTLSSKFSAKAATTVTGKATAVQPKHLGSFRPGSTVTKSVVAAKAAANVKATKPMVRNQPGAPTNALNKEVPVPLRGSTPNPILPIDSMEDSGIVAKANVVPLNRPATKSSTPLPVSNPLEPSKPKAAGQSGTNSTTRKEVAANGGNAAKASTPPPARGGTPPENGCAGEAASKASAESARLVEE